MTTQLTRSITLLPIRAGLWRVAGPSGAILGHIERHASPDGDRYTARRLVFATLTRDVGEFWHLADAADCFR